MKNKKSIVAIQVLITFLLALFVFVILALIFPRMLGGSAKEATDLLSSSRDYDNDGIADFFDKCPCDSGEADLDGCPNEGVEKEYQSQVKIKACKTEINKAYNPKS
jgi:hypothetical protein